MSRLSNPGCMLRMMSALFGTIFLPVGISFFFVLHHRYWLQGIGAVVAALGFFYVAWRAEDILGLDTIDDTREMVLPGFVPGNDDATGPAPDANPDPDPDRAPPDSEEPHP